MRKRFVTLTLLLGLFGSACCDAGINLQGVVIEAEGADTAEGICRESPGMSDSRAVENAKVSFGPAKGTTDETGWFQFDSVTGGCFSGDTYEIEVSHPEYRNYEAKRKRTFCKKDFFLIRVLPESDS